MAHTRREKSVHKERQHDGRGIVLGCTDQRLAPLHKYSSRLYRTIACGKSSYTLSILDAIIGIDMPSSS